MQDLSASDGNVSTSLSCFSGNVGHSKLNRKVKLAPVDGSEMNSQFQPLDGDIASLESEAASRAEEGRLGEVFS